MFLRNLASILIGACLLFLGCKTTKIGSTEKVVERSKNHLVKQLKNSALDFDIFNGKGKVKYNDGETRLSFNANVRIRRDSIIWINASFLGFEVARIVIRPDSVFAVNRYEKTYLVESYEHFDSLYQVPATFSQLQDIILGNNLINTKKAIDLEFETPNYFLTQKEDVYHISQVVDGSFFSPVEVKVEDIRSGYEIYSRLSDQKAIDKSRFFSYFRSYIIKKDNIQTASIQINYSDIDTKTIKKLPFSIPSSYSPSGL